MQLNCKTHTRLAPCSPLDECRRQWQHFADLGHALGENPRTVLAFAMMSIFQADRTGPRATRPSPRNSA